MNEEQVIKNIRSIAPKHCDNCGTKYSPNDFKILRVIESSALLHLHCSGCGNTYVINAYANNIGIGSQRMPLILDLEDVDEVEKFANMPSITKDDAIDLFNLLGDSSVFSNLISKTSVENKKKVKSLNS